MFDALSQFRDAIRATGLEPPEDIVTGQLYRFPGVGKGQGNRAGWCRLFDDGKGGCFGDWSSGISECWQASWHKPSLKPDLGVAPHKVRQSLKITPQRDNTSRIEGAVRVWGASSSICGTLAEVYLQSRNLHLPLPPALRFHASLKHPSGGSWPALVGLVTNGADNTPLAIHRTYIAPEGIGKAPVNPQKMMLGPCRGGAVRLGASGDILMVGEGIETCLAAMQETGNPAWAALSTSGLRTLDLPSEVLDVIVLADGDEPGEAAARDCASRWQREGRRVRIARPPQGLDFNDLIMGPVRQVEEDQTW